MDIVEIVGLSLAAAAAGAINAVAGGGSLVSFPALLAFGYDAKPANVTNTVALWPGYLGGSVGYRAELSTQRARVTALLVPAIAGALVGSGLLLATSGDAFETLVPFLVLFACLLMGLQDRIRSWISGLHIPSSEVPASAPLVVSVFVLGAYGAYFGGALGIMTLAVLGVFAPDDIQQSNALKGLLSLIINAAAVVAFVLFGPVRWAPAAVMAVGSILGGYFGVGIARRLGPRALRSAVIVYGVVVAVVLLVR